MASKSIQIYDTTLRDGTQAEDISLTVEDKLRIATRLDWLGISFIEGGWPGANPRDTEFFQRARTELKLGTARLVAFGATRRTDTDVESDTNLRNLIGAETPVVCIFGKSWDLHVRKTLRIPLKDNLTLIRESVAFLRKNKKRVVYDAEHFFDGFRENRGYALQTLKAARHGGAEVLVLCDTNGGTLPSEVSRIVGIVKKSVRAELGIHCHNDSGVAVANSLAAVEAGAGHVQGTMNGIGERCGNANLVTIIADLELKMGKRAVGAKKLERLAEVSQFVDEMANRAPNKHQPYVGKSAFAHKGGVHVHAVLKEARTYEHIDPTKVGNRQRVLVSDLSGGATIVHKAREFGVELSPDNPRVRELLRQLKELEKQGYLYEGAEASFEILVKKALDLYRPHFRLHDFRVTDTISADEKRGPTSEAVIHLSVEGREGTAVAKGVGPVHALDQGLRDALEKFYPGLRAMKLLDYKVRVLPAPKGPLVGAGAGTASSVRVLIECGDLQSRWTTVGVSENIIQASYQALVDGIDYKLMKDGSAGSPQARRVNR